jgi:hypothetical protein
MFAGDLRFPGGLGFIEGLRVTGVLKITGCRKLHCKTAMGIRQILIWTMLTRNQKTEG